MCPVVGKRRSANLAYNCYSNALLPTYAGHVNDIFAWGGRGCDPNFRIITRVWVWAMSIMVSLSDFISSRCLSVCLRKIHTCIYFCCRAAEKERGVGGKGEIHGNAGRWELFE